MAAESSNGNFIRMDFCFHLFFRALIYKRFLCFAHGVMERFVQIRKSFRQSRQALNERAAFYSFPHCLPVKNRRVVLARTLSPPAGRWRGTPGGRGCRGSAGSPAQSRRISASARQPCRGRAVLQEIAGVELHAGLGGIDLHADAGLIAGSPSAQALAGPAPCR